jgi:hypothetical protein
MPKRRSRGRLLSGKAFASLGAFAAKTSMILGVAGTRAYGRLCGSRWPARILPVGGPDAGRIHPASTVRPRTARQDPQISRSFAHLAWSTQVG